MSSPNRDNPPSIADRARGFLQDAQRQARRAQLEAELLAAYRKLGQIAYEAHLAQPCLPISCSAALERVRAHRDEIESLRNPAPPPAASGSFCPGCGRTVPPDARFCPGCGHSLG